MIWIIAGVYFLCGLGVTLALDDDNDDGINSPLISVTAFLITTFLWPLFFMFALTSMIRSVAEGCRRQIVVRPEAEVSNQRKGAGE